MKRTRELLRIGWIVAAGVLAALAITPGELRIAAALATSVLGSAWMYHRLRDPRRYSAAQLNTLALVAVVCGQLGILYVGVFSAALLVVALGLYFFCRTEHTASAVAIYAIAAGAHAIATALVIASAPRSRLLSDPRRRLAARADRRPADPAARLRAVLLARARLAAHLAALNRAAAARDAARGAARRLRRDLDRALEVGGPG